MNTALATLSAAGVSVWLDDLSRQRLNDGSLAQLIQDMSVVGVTTNPSIFHKAITSTAVDYAQQLSECVAGGLTSAQTVRALTVTDVTAACELFMPIFEATNGVDGRVSIEVDPRLAHDTAGTIAEARELHAAVNRPNVLIKIPATKAGLPAITEVIGCGISVNVTLIFGVERYIDVLQAFVDGLAIARDRGHDLSAIHSVASFFVSRVDTSVDSALTTIGTAEAKELLGKAAIANAQLAWGAFLKFTQSDQWMPFAASARPQRPLWASTGVKNPDYDQAMYVTSLICHPCVNTMPEATLLAASAVAMPDVDTMTPHLTEAEEVWTRLESLGISHSRTVEALEIAGVQQFIDAWVALLEAVEKEMASTA